MQPVVGKMALCPNQPWLGIDNPWKFRNAESSLCAILVLRKTHFICHQYAIFFPGFFSLLYSLLFLTKVWVLGVWVKVLGWAFGLGFSVDGCSGPAV